MIWIKSCNNDTCTSCGSDSSIHEIKVKHDNAMGYDYEYIYLCNKCKAELIKGLVDTYIK